MGNFEDEIKSKVFKNERHKAVLNLIYTANDINYSHAPLFKEYGLLQQHYNVLRIVRGRKGEPVSPGEIIKVMMDKGRDLTRLVDKLVSMDLLERNQSMINRRKVDITITNKGLEITKKIELKFDEWVESKIDISEEQAIQLNKILDQLRGFD